MYFLVLEEIIVSTEIFVAIGMRTWESWSSTKMSEFRYFDWIWESTYVYRVCGWTGYGASDARHG